MKTKDIKKGISLIVLVITIIVVIILAAVVILTLSKNNPIESAKEARFKEDVRTFQDELAMTVSKQYAQAGGKRDEKISTSNFNEIKEYISSFSKKYRDKLIIQDDEIVYTSKVTENEKIYLSSLNVKREFNYIQEGLILHLDGINNTRNGHSTTTTTWEDLSGNNNDFEKLSSASNAIWSENSFVGDATNRTLVIYKAILNGATECTVEVCYDIPQLKDYYWVFQSRYTNGNANGFQFAVNSSNRGVTICNGNNQNNSLSSFKLVTDIGKRTMAFSVNSSSVIFSDNGEFYTEDTKSGVIQSLMPRNPYTIGSSYPWNGTANRFKGNIYSIRIYNRKLSENELRNNYEVDKARFGI